MNKLGSFLNPLVIVSLILVNDASSEQVRTFILEQNGIHLQFRVSLSKDFFYALEEIPFNVVVKNISKRPFLGPSISSPWWIVEHESGALYKYPGTAIQHFDSVRLAPGSSIQKSIILERIDSDRMISHQYFPLGQYRVFCGPDTAPFIFRIVIDSSLKNHIRRAKFVQFCETHQPGKYFFDTTLGVPRQLVPLGNDFSNGQSVNNSMEPAYEFLESNKEMFGITNPRSELLGELKNKSGDTVIVTFNQIYKGVIVWNSNIVFFLDPSGRVRWVNGTLHPDVDISTSYRISDTAAISIVRKKLGVRGKELSIEKPSLGILCDKTKYYLAWLIRAETFSCYVDANNGSIIPLPMSY
jgi:hypothetical protein